MLEERTENNYIRKKGGCGSDVGSGSGSCTYKLGDLASYLTFPSLYVLIYKMGDMLLSTECVRPSLPISYSTALTLQVMVFGGDAFGR